jgi:hypothetical protein
MPPLVRLLAVLVTAATFLSPAATLARSLKPFKAAITFNETVQPDGTGTCGPIGSSFLGTISGTGQATHMGKVSITSRDCITFMSATTFTFGSTELVLIAANGDKISATYTGTFEIEDGVGVITGTYTITGGSGRFSGATGRGTVQGLETLNPTTFQGQGQVQLTGTISY